MRLLVLALPRQEEEMCSTGALSSSTAAGRQAGQFTAFNSVIQLITCFDIFWFLL